MSYKNIFYLALWALRTHFLVTISTLTVAFSVAIFNHTTRSKSFRDFVVKICEFSTIVKVDIFFKSKFFNSDQSGKQSWGHVI